MYKINYRRDAHNYSESDSLDYGLLDDKTGRAKPPKGTPWPEYLLPFKRGKLPKNSMARKDVALFCIDKSNNLPALRWLIEQSDGVLDLSNSELTADELVAICAGLKDLEIPVALNLSANGFGDGRAKILAGLLAKMPNITSLDLSRNLIRKHGVGAICATLSNNTTLTSLNLAGNPCAGAGNAVGQMLLSNRGLISLNLSVCNLGDQSIAKIMAALGRKVSLLQNLSLAWNNKYCGIASVKAIAAAAPKLWLKSLDLSGMEKLFSSGSSTKSLCDALAGNKHLESLSLRDCPHSRGIAAIIRKSETITSLDLGRLHFNEKNSVLVALGANTRLKRLTLANGGSDEKVFVASLCAMLRQPESRLEHLDIENCDLPNDLATILVDALLDNKTVTSVRAPDGKHLSEENRGVIEDVIADNGRIVRSNIFQSSQLRLENKQLFHATIDKLHEASVPEEDATKLPLELCEKIVDCIDDPRAMDALSNTITAVLSDKSIRSQVKEYQ
jgi:hypothetical protein